MRILMLAAFAATALGATPALAAGESFEAKKARGCTVTPANLPIGKLPTLGPVVRCPTPQAIAETTCSTQRYHTPSGKLSTVRKCDAVASSARGGQAAGVD